MPITPEEARSARHAETTSDYARLDECLTQVATTRVATGQPLTCAIKGFDRDVVERVVAAWKNAGWSKARVVGDQREGDYIQLN